MPAPVRAGHGCQVRERGERQTLSFEARADPSVLSMTSAASQLATVGAALGSSA